MKLYNGSDGTEQLWLELKQQFFAVAVTLTVHSDTLRHTLHVR